MSGRAIVLVLDSLGIGGAPDAGRFGDFGADTLGHIAAACALGQADHGRSGAIKLPNLADLGLFHAHAEATGTVADGVTLPSAPQGAWAPAIERSAGKDTPSGHWEMAGVPVLEDFGYFREREHSFPDDLLTELIARAGLPGVLGNCHASGTEIIDRLGPEHIATGRPIVYTSADSVFQIAAHETHFGLERLYEICAIARELVTPWRIGRVIARPFVGSPETGFQRSGNRRDLSLEPPAPTLLDRLVEAGGEVIAVGKIADIYAHRGISRVIKAHGNDALFDATLAAVEAAGAGSLVMTNFVDFDTLHGHRRDIAGYARALEAFDARLPELLAVLDDDDLLILSADHGCDPSFPGSDHTREQVPILARGAGLAPGSLGQRTSFADIGQSLAEFFRLDPMPAGLSFLPPQAALLDRLRALIQRAYAPYSKHPVAAIAIDEHGQAHAGVNVECAHFKSQCAEASALAALRAGGGARLQRLYILGPDTEPCPPCGDCRQRLLEFADPDCPIHLLADDGRRRADYRLGDLLPAAFDGERLGD